MKFKDETLSYFYKKIANVMLKYYTYVSCSTQALDIWSGYATEI